MDQNKSTSDIVSSPIINPQGGNYVSLSTMKTLLIRKQYFGYFARENKVPVCSFYHHFSRTWMLIMECKVLQQLHNIISGSLYKKHHTDDHCVPADQSPTGTSLLQAVLSVSALLGLWVQCPPSYPRHEAWWPCADSRAGTRKGTVSLFGMRRAVSMMVAPLLFFMPSFYSCRLSLSWSSWPWLCFPGVSAFSSVPGHVPRSSWPASRTAVHWQ